jgi:hypothetical protein
MEFNAWCLQVLQEYNHVAFARALAKAFELSTIDDAGTPRTLDSGDIYGFLHRNMFQHGCIDEVMLRLRPGMSMLSLAEMTKSSDDLRTWRELRQFQEMSEIAHARAAVRHCAIRARLHLRAALGAASRLLQRAELNR